MLQFGHRLPDRRLRIVSCTLFIFTRWLISAKGWTFFVIITIRRGPSGQSVSIAMSRNRAVLDSKGKLLDKDLPSSLLTDGLGCPS